MYRLFPLSHAGIDAISDVNIPSDVPNNPMQVMKELFLITLFCPILKQIHLTDTARYHRQWQSLSEWHFIAKKHVLHAPQRISDKHMEADLAFMILI